MNSIAHSLSNRSGFSIGESTLSISALVTRAEELGFKSVALVDTMSVSGMPELASATKGKDIKPILGCNLHVYDDPTWRKPKGPGPKKQPYHTLKVYVHTEDGLRQVYKLLTLANTEDHFYYEARVSLEEIIGHLLPGDVSISTGDFQSLFQHDDWQGRFTRLNAHFGSNLWVEAVPINTPLFDVLNKRAERAWGEIADRQGALMTYPTLYPTGGADSADVLRAIAQGNKMSDGWLPVPYIRDFEQGSPNDMVARARKVIARGAVGADFLRQAMLNIPAFAGLDFYRFEKKAPSLPVMAPDEFAALVAQCKAGWVRRFSAPVLGHQPTAVDLVEKYKPRLAYELSVIRDMGFSGYFLLVQEIVQWSKANEIMVGPGRGSVGGSLIAYLMDITDVDPIRFNLLFERFINPSRVDLPDADLDFMSTRRHEVLKHIEDTYGIENVAGISNYSTLGPASAMRDTSRVFGLDQFEYAASKQTEKEHGASVPLAISAENVPDLAKFRDKYPLIWGHALNLEGCMRNVGRHAAGVVVAGEPIVNRAVVETRSGGQVTNWDKYTVEDHGLIKMDILGLTTLDILKRCAEYVQVRHFKTIDFLKLPLDDELVLRNFGQGHTVGVFQYESAGMRKLLTSLREGGPLSFDDLAAVTALFRPGPLDAGMCDEYTAIKQGKQLPYYEHPNVEAALKPTFGVIIYQESVMQICRDLSGFTFAEADNVRKAMGKKDPVKMAEYRQKFIDGALSVSAMGDYQAGNLWDKLAGFAAYGFNKSHAYAYTVVSYQSMWLKTYYPAEFFAAAMSIVDDDAKLAALMIDAKRCDIDVLPPDINVSTDRIEIRGERELIAPFQAVKGISESTAASIATLRREMIKGTAYDQDTKTHLPAQPGGFTSLANMVAILTALKRGAKCNVAVRSKLERVGAFHSTDGGLAPMDPGRLKDRLELMPGFTVDTVKADRVIVNDAFTVSRIIRIAADADACSKCDLKGSTHVRSRMGKTPKFMVVFDVPSWQEEKAGQMLEGDNAAAFKAALKDAGISANHGYYTSLIKAAKPKGQKMLTTDQINACSGYLLEEIEVLKPPVIVAMGSAAIKFFAPTIKGNPSDLIGKVVFDPKRDASILFGLNPAQVFFDPSKVVLLETVARKIAELIL